MSDETNVDKKASYRKLIYVAIAVIGVLAVTLGGSALGVSEEDRSKAIDALKWFFSMLIGGHVLTDITALVRNGKSQSGQMFDVQE